MCEIFPSGLPVASVFYAFGESTLPGKVIVFLLMLGSIVAWTIMISKWNVLKKARNQSRLFLQQYRSQQHPVGLYLQKRDFSGSPLFQVYETSCHAIGCELDIAAPSQGFQQNQENELPDKLTGPQLDAITSLADREMADQILAMEANTNILATAVSCAPFLGLLGTVWGVMDGFGGMAAAGSATLSAVAPGISAALLTTVVGLVVALPSVIGYNILAGHIRTLTIQMESFTQEFGAAIHRAYGNNL